MRQRHEYVMSKSGLTPSSHSGKALRHILETLPREELFQSNEEELYRTAIGILGLQERVRSRMFLRRDKYSRFISALVYIPRERFNTDVRLRIEALLKDALHGEYIDSSVVLGESPLAQLHLIVRPKSGEALEFNTTELESRLAHLLRNWRDALRGRWLRGMAKPMVCAWRPTSVVRCRLAISKIPRSNRRCPTSSIWPRWTARTTCT